MAKLNKVIHLLEDSLEQLRSDPSVKRFEGGTFIAWKENVKAILSQVSGTRSATLIHQFSIATKDLPMPASLVIPGYLEGELERIFEAKLPNVEKTLENIVLQLKNFPDEKGAIQAIGDLKTKLQGLWRWIESHKVISILTALASIATIALLIIALLNLE